MDKTKKDQGALASYLEREMKRLKQRTPEERQADRENSVPGILIGHEEMVEFKEMSSDEQKEKVKDFNLRLAESTLVGPPHRSLDDEI